jgi:hypothetical protein
MWRDHTGQIRLLIADILMFDHRNSVAVLERKVRMLMQQIDSSAEISHEEEKPIEGLQHREEKDEQL